jgi:hypothetical protein
VWRFGAGEDFQTVGEDDPMGTPEGCIPVSAIKDWVKDHPHKGFKPLPFYSEIGDMLSWYWSSEGPSYAVPVMLNNIHVGSIERHMETNEVVGVKIYGIKGMVTNG